ncbi:MAG: lysoplasmalogenase [Gemmatimonadota bacterium]
MTVRQLLPFLAVAAAVLNTRADALGLRSQVHVFKPLATLALVAIVLRAAGTSRYRSWIAVGLVASLAGDILLMLPPGRFVLGLVAFLMAHLSYIRAFASDGAGVRAPLLPGIPVLVAAIAVLAFLWPSLGAMRIPVACYVATIAVMSWQALARWQVRRSRDAAFAAVGSLFFLVSDSALAIDRFVAPYPGAVFVVLGTYYAAQWGLTLSAATERGVGRHSN